ncbi:MAG: hypothetical protein ACXADL_07080 [Candidatus Thorarchaeota archaeon]|jgi:hypothetical protein
MSEEQTERSKTYWLSPGGWVSIILTLTLTPLAAVFLSEFGYIQLDVVTAAIDGFLVALVYVLFRLGNAKRVENLKAKAALKDDWPPVSDDQEHHDVRIQ